jgi:hypothetical protein
VSYLGPEYIKRPNLAVLLHARVLRLGRTKSSSGDIAFRGVQFTQDAGGIILISFSPSSMLMMY